MINKAYIYFYYHRLIQQPRILYKSLAVINNITTTKDINNQVGTYYYRLLQTSLVKQFISNVTVNRMQPRYALERCISRR